MEMSGRHSPTHSLNPPSSSGICSGSDNSSISGFGGSDNSTGSSDKSSVSNGGEDSGCDTCDKEDPVAAAATHLTAVRKAANAQEHPDRGPSLGLLHLASTLHQHGDHTLSDTLCGKLCLFPSLFPWCNVSHYSLLHHYSHFLTHWGATPLFLHYLPLTCTCILVTVSFCLMVVFSLLHTNAAVLQTLLSPTIP